MTEQLPRPIEPGESRADRAVTRRRRLVDFTITAGFLIAIVGVFAAWAGTEWWWAVIVAGVAVMLAAGAVNDE